MVVASLLPYLRDHSRAAALVAILATLLAALGLLAFVVLLGAAMADSSAVDVPLVGPFRWGPVGDAVV